MGFCNNFRHRRLELTGRESGETLGLMQAWFQDGANWTQGMYENASGARCLVGAANHVRVSSIDDAKQFLRLAIAEIAPGVARIEDFNDTRRTYAEVAAVIERAKQLAAQSVVRALPAPPVVEILPPERQALPPATSVALPRARSRRPSLASWIMD
jgi:hypothetical protein